MASFVTTIAFAQDSEEPKAETELKYADAGVIEAGGSLGLMAADGYFQMVANPQVGYFFMDNFQISAIMGINWVNLETADATVFFTALAEPSFHYPISDSEKFFGFGGIGFGLASFEGTGSAFALSPRVGVNYTIGNAGVITPSLYFTTTTGEAVSTPIGDAIQVDFVYGLTIGFTVYL